ncbi:hypothetical protein M0R72_01195 [Candidatus Pacearchaeota archaeon]|jgi:predicted RNA-binding Zn-ribbon protein involved in translation (DUF1610 family)|nr:hypothetical protein [Candidatus Pacearchaeota archaeon]
MFDAPYEAIFLLPEPLCKSCGAKIPPSDSGADSSACPQCGEIFHWSLREKVATAAIMAYVSAEVVKEEAARILREFKARRWCKRHGFQRVLPLEHPPGRTLEYCVHCIAVAMAHPPTKSSPDDCPGVFLPRNQ